MTALTGRDVQGLADLVEFARLEVAAADIEPWAAVLHAMKDPDIAAQDTLTTEQALWLLSLYNTTDDILSALTIADLCPDVHAWPAVTGRGRELVAGVRLSGERRNLYGGRILDRLDSYAALVGKATQAAWVAEPTPSTVPRANFMMLMPWLRRVWGVGRLSAFEWAEFLHKVHGSPVETTDGALWESSGPRESLERLYGQHAPGKEWLTDRAHETRDLLRKEGVPLSWWDFETVICDFNVLRKGRYYPGKHLAMISEEIAGLPDKWRPVWERAFRAVVPAPWCDLPPGVNKPLCKAYTTTGLIRTPLQLPLPLEV